MPPEDYVELLLRMDTRLDVLTERMASVEGRQSEADKLSKKKWVAEYGGIVALFLSILIGGFTLYDKLVNDPGKARAQAAAELRTDMNQLSNIVATIAGLNWSNAPAATVQMNSLTPQRLALLDKIKREDKANPGILQFGDRLALAVEYETFARLDDALEQIAVANHVASDATQIANGHWAEARIKGKQKHVDQMRKLYSQSIDELKAVGMLNTAVPIMQVYTQWISLEFIYGDCAHAAEANRRMTDDMKSPDVWPGTRIQVAKDFN